MEEEIMKIALIAIALVLTFRNSPADADSDLPNNRNCVDVCILTYCKILGDSIEVEKLDKAILHCGLALDVKSRNLRECKAILKILGHDVSAVELDLNSRHFVPLTSIIYLPPLFSHGSIGHVAILTPHETNRYSIYDPLHQNQLKPNKIQVADKVIVLTSYRDAWFVFIQNMFHSGFQALMVVLSGFLIWKFVKAIKTRVGQVTICGITVVAMCGCESGSQPDVKIENGMVHDFGVFDCTEDPAVVDHSFVLKNYGTSNRKIVLGQASCGCLVDGATCREKVLNAGESTTFPVSIGLEQKWGLVRERLTVSVDGVKDSRINLELTGFALHPPLPKAAILGLQSFPPERKSGSVDIVQLLPLNSDRSKVISSEITSDHGGSLTLADCIIHEIEKRGAKEIVWSFPVKMELPDNVVEVSGVLRVRIGTSDIQVAITGRRTGPIDVQSTIMMPQLRKGVEHVEIIPVTIFESPSKSIQFIIDSNEIRINLMEQESSLEVVFLPTKVGDFSHLVICRSPDGESNFTIKGYVE